MARHRWSAPARFLLKTERSCQLCGCVRVTRRDAGPARIPWVEFWRDGERIAAAGRTPACEGASNIRAAS